MTFQVNSLEGGDAEKGERVFSVEELLVLWVHAVVDQWIRLAVVVLLIVQVVAVGSDQEGLTLQVAAVGQHLR